MLVFCSVGASWTDHKCQKVSSLISERTAPAFTSICRGILSTVTVMVNDGQPSGHTAIDIVFSAIADG